MTIKPWNIRCGWCGRRRGFLPHRRYDGSALPDPVVAALRDAIMPVWAGALICGKCDYDHGAATVIPREHAIRDFDPRA